MNYESKCVKRADDLKVKDAAKINGQYHQLNLKNKISQLKTDIEKVAIDRTKAVVAVDYAAGLATDNTDAWLAEVKAAQSKLDALDKKVKDLEYSIDFYEKLVKEYFTNIK